VVALSGSTADSSSASPARTGAGISAAPTRIRANAARRTPTDSETPVTAEPSSERSQTQSATAEAGAVLRNSRHAVELADEPHISHDTVRTHVPSATTKLGADLVAKALGDGLLLA
jgi:DNA-binding NarL/FixJ family response regulator